MPKLSSAPPGTRIFGRLERFHLECPTCGLIVFANTAPQMTFMREARGVRSKLRRRGFRKGAPFNALSSRLRCPSCEKEYAVGLILYPVGRSGNRTLPKAPADHKPDARQLAELRTQTTALWASEDYKRKMGDELNVFVTAECTCPEAPGGWAPRCPIHGDRATGE